MKKFLLMSLFIVLLLSVSVVYGVPGYYAQIDLIAANTERWKQDVEFGLWGFVVTDLDQNGRLEIISCSVQGTGFYSFINAYEVNEDGTGLNDLMADLALRTDSSPDIMVGKTTSFFDKENFRYYYIFDDFIRNGMAEYYENKRAVTLNDGKWIEIPLASKSTIFTDEEHSSVSFLDSEGKEISESQYNAIPKIVFGNLEAGEICFNWVMTENDEFASLSTQQLTDKLKDAGNGICL